MTLGEQIKQARENKNLSQEELAERLGVSRQAVSKWENDSSIPQGVNRELLAQVLELELLKTEPDTQKNKGMTWLGWLGWIAAIVLVILLLVVVCDWSGQQKVEQELDNETQATPEPTINRITFYDSNQNEVAQEALWYNAAQIESILIQWEGGTPDNIKMFSTPSGSETMEQTELLLTKSILDGDSVALLDGDALNDIFQGHVFFELDFGNSVVVSDIYNIFYDESILEE